MEKSAGRFRCAANGTEWSRLDKGSLDDQFITTGLNLIPLYNGPIQIDPLTKLVEVVYAHKSMLPFPAISKLIALSGL